jgi:hypothetical protein
MIGDSLMGRQVDCMLKVAGVRLESNGWKEHRDGSVVCDDNGFSGGSGGLKHNKFYGQRISERTTDIPPSTLRDETKPRTGLVLEPRLLIAAMTAAKRSSRNASTWQLEYNNTLDGDDDEPPPPQQQQQQQQQSTLLLLDQGAHFHSETTFQNTFDQFCPKVSECSPSQRHCRLSDHDVWPQRLLESELPT